MTYIFTYGSNHQNAQGLSLGRSYTPVEADTPADARAVMSEARGDKWSMIYDSKEKAGVEKWGLSEKSIDEVRIR